MTALPLAGKVALIILLCGDPFASLTGQTLRLDSGWTIPSWEYRPGTVEWQEDS